MGKAWEFDESGRLVRKIDTKLLHIICDILYRQQSYRERAMQTQGPRVSKDRKGNKRKTGDVPWLGRWSLKPKVSQSKHNQSKSIYTPWSLKDLR